MDIITEKINILYDFTLIEKDDARKDDIRKCLEGKNRVQIDNWMHDILVGNKTLDEKLEGRKH